MPEKELKWKRGGFVAIMMPFSALSRLRYSVAIQLPQDEDDADALALLGLVLVTTVSLLLLGVIALWGHSISALLKMPGHVSLSYFIPAAVSLNGNMTFLNSWYLGAMEFSVWHYQKLRELWATERSP